MAHDNIEHSAALIQLNEEIARQEQQGETARGFFQNLLSDQLLFRRANGKVVGKSGPEGFLDGLKNNPFSSRTAEEIAVSLLDDRMLVTLIIIGTRKDDGSVHRYRNIRLFSRAGDQWILELWYNYEIMHP